LIDVHAPEDGFLLLADTFYPGWIAKVDGVPTPIYRANGSLRAVQVPKGLHRVRFRYEAPAYMRGLRISLVALALLLLWAAAAIVVDRRARSRAAT
jgi:uncharacterized membrane protein YfhO